MSVSVSHERPRRLLSYVSNKQGWRNIICERSQKDVCVGMFLRSNSDSDVTQLLIKIQHSHIAEYSVRWKAWQVWWRQLKRKVISDVEQIITLKRFCFKITCWKIIYKTRNMLSDPSPLSNCFSEMNAKRTTIHI